VSAETFEAILELKSALIMLRRQSERGLPIPPMLELQAVVAALAQGRPARVTLCPEEHRVAWKKVLSGGQGSLSLGSIRFLVWEPAVVLDPRFHRYMDRQNYSLGARGLQGLVRACHLHWPTVMKDGTILEDARRRLLSYRGPNRIVRRWQDNVEMVLDPHGPSALGSWMITGLHSPGDTAAEWSIDSTSAFYLEAIKMALIVARTRWRDEAEIAAFVCHEILSWNGWPVEHLKREIAECVLHADAWSDNVNDRLKALVLSHPNLGDPRLPANQKNWLGVRIQAKQRVIEWLSKADIVFFFDHAFPRGGDPHRRKPFWLKYVSRVVMSRPLLCRDDAMRLRTHQGKDHDEVGNYGEVDGFNSVFLMSFGDICAVEFSHIGACYLYTRRNMERVLPDFWARDFFSERNLRRRDACVARIVHRRGWEVELQNTLSRLGVRP
jgi:hypothetical protein